MMTNNTINSHAVRVSPYNTVPSTKALKSILKNKNPNLQYEDTSSSEYTLSVNSSTKNNSTLIYPFTIDSSSSVYPPSTTLPRQSNLSPYISQSNLSSRDSLLTQKTVSTVPSSIDTNNSNRIQSKTYQTLTYKNNQSHAVHASPYTKTFIHPGQSNEWKNQTITGSNIHDSTSNGCARPASPKISAKHKQNDIVLINGMPYPVQIQFPAKISKKAAAQPTTRIRPESTINDHFNENKNGHVVKSMQNKLPTVLTNCDIPPHNDNGFQQARKATFEHGVPKTYLQIDHGTYDQDGPAAVDFDAKTMDDSLSFDYDDESNYFVKDGFVNSGSTRQQEEGAEEEDPLLDIIRSYGEFDSLTTQN